MKQTRIGMIRNTIVKHGGRPDVTYYADGPNATTGGRRRGFVKVEDGEVRYKIDKFTDGLTSESRRAVAEELNSRDDVSRAYISRRINHARQPYVYSNGRHLIVVFKHKANYK